MKFRTQYNTKPSPPEIGGGEKIVESAGYIPAHKQIENLVLAGKRLVSYREQFDFTGDDKIDESYTDPTRASNFDLADATQLALQAEANLQRAQAQQINRSNDSGSTQESAEVSEQA